MQAPAEKRFHRLRHGVFVLHRDLAEFWGFAEQVGWPLLVITRCAESDTPADLP